MACQEGSSRRSPSHCSVLTCGSPFLLLSLSTTTVELPFSLHGVCFVMRQCGRKETVEKVIATLKRSFLPEQDLKLNLNVCLWGRWGGECWQCLYKTCLLYEILKQIIRTWDMCFIMQTTSKSGPPVLYLNLKIFWWLAYWMEELVSLYAANKLNEHLSKGQTYKRTEITGNWMTTCAKFTQVCKQSKD